MLVSGMAATVRRCESLREIIKKFDKATSDVSLGVVVPQTVPEDPGPVTEDNWQQRCLYDMELDRERNHEQDKPGDFSMYEELNMIKGVEHRHQLYKNDKNFTLSVKELKRVDGQKKSRHLDQHHRAKPDIKNEETPESVRPPQPEDEVIFADSLMSHRPPPPLPSSVVEAKKSSKVKQDLGPFSTSLDLQASQSIPFRKLNFDVVTVGSKRVNKKKTQSVGIEWSRSKSLLLLWTVVALILWIVTYMILRLVYVI